MKRVLVIDDDDDVRELVTWKLSHAGYSTLAAADGEAGVLAATTGDADELPDVVLVDWMMPKMTGVEVCAALRDNPLTAAIPIILVTAKAQEAEVQRGFAAGADDYIVKPFSPKEMLARIEAVLTRSEGGP